MIQAFDRDFQRTTVRKAARTFLAQAFAFLLVSLAILSVAVGPATAAVAPTIVTQPADLAVIAGDSAVFSVTANDAISYEWQAQVSGSWQPFPEQFPFSGVNTNVFTIDEAALHMSSWKIRVVVSGPGGTTTNSNPATLTVNEYQPPVAITSQPSDRAVNANENTTLFSVAAANATGYQWQFRENSGASWSDILGAALYYGSTSDTLSVFYALPALNGFQYRVIVSGAGGPVTSAAATLTVNQSASTNANLSALTLSSGTLSPAFAAGTTSYTATVASSVSTITVTPTAADATAGITVNGSVVASGSASGAITLIEGSNQITVIVTAQDGITEKVYRVSVTREAAPSDNVYLSSLHTSQGTLSPAFAPGTWEYSLVVPADTDSVDITPTLQDPAATLLFDWSPIVSGQPHRVDVPATGWIDVEFWTKAPSNLANGLYKIRVSRAASASTNADLSGLTISSGVTNLTLNPAFTPDTTNYTAMVIHPVALVSVTPQLADNNATVTVDGSPVTQSSPSSLVPLEVGSNVISVVVTAQDGTTKRTYTVDVTRAGAMPMIATITPSEKLVTEDNTTATITGMNLSGAQSVVFGTVHATNLQIINDSKITVLVPHNLPGVYDVTVNTAAGNVKSIKAFTYKIPPSNKANLANLELDGAALDFESDGANFSAEVENTVASVAVIPTLDTDSSAAKITVNDTEVASGVASPPIPLAVGDNLISVVVTAEDQTTKRTYKITVTRKAAATKIWSMTPKTGSTSGGEPIIIGGKGLAVVTGITFGGVPATNLRIIDDNQLSVTTPAHPAGVVEVIAQLPNGGIAPYSGGFLYVGAPAEISLSPATGSLPGGTVATAYSVSIIASGGTGPYAYTVTSGSLPSGLSLAANGTLSGTPSVAGKASFTVTATDSNNVAGSASYTLVIAPVSKPAITLSPKSGDLPEAMAGEEYVKQITASGGTGALTFSVVSGALPKDLVLDSTTGALSGTPAAGTEGDYAFSIEARDGAGGTGAANYALKVVPRAVTVTNKSVDVEPGSSPLNVNLEDGATGGPFGDGAVTFVEPANAGRASIVRGEFAASDPMAAPLGWYLKFIPNPAFSGEARVGFRLTSELGASNVGTVIYKLSHDAAQVARDIDGLVHGFVQTRQNLIASNIKVPGLMERRRMQAGADPVTARMTPSADGITLGFATSTAQMEAARNLADGAQAAHSLPFNIWVDGTMMAHNREENGGKWGSFAMVSLGADYLLSERALVGLSFHFDRMTDPTDANAEVTGKGWLIGPNVSLEIGRGVFWDTKLLYGGSSNDIDTSFWDGSFGTTRWLLDTEIQGQWNLGNAAVLTPALRAVYLSEEVGPYGVENGAGDRIEIDGFTEEQLRVSLGAEIERQFILDNGMRLTPKFGATVGFSGLDGSGAFGRVSTGLSLETVDAWSIDASLLFNIEGDGQKSTGAKIGVSGRF